MKADGQRQDPAPPTREPSELRVEPTSVGSGRRSSLPGAVAVGLSLFVAVAVWKPWANPSATPPASPRVASAPVASADVAAGSSSPGTPGHVLPVDGTPLPSDGELLAASTRRPVWGLRAIVIRGGTEAYLGEPRVVERWMAVDPELPAAPAAAAPAAISGPDDDVAALGVTTLDVALPLDVRFWSLPTNGPPQRLAPIAIAGPEAGSWLWLPGPAHGTDRGTWQAGAYEVEVLLGSSMVRLELTIPSASRTTPRVAAPFGQPPFETILEGLEPGPFALADGGAKPLAGGTPPVVDEREAWLGPAAGLPSVATVAARQVTGFGMLLAAGDEPVRVDVRQLGPRSSAIETGLNIPTVGPDDRRAIIAWPVSDGVFEDGVYHVTVSWTSGGTDRTASWTIEVQPSIPASPPNAPLDAMRRWVGLIDQPANGAGEPILYLDGEDGGGCEPSTVVTGHDQLLGIVTPPGVDIERMRLIPNDVFQSSDIPIRYAIDAAPRLTVVALPGGGLPLRDYSLVVTQRSSGGVTVASEELCVAGP